jgi:hypothetical protein
MLIFSFIVFVAAGGVIIGYQFGRMHGEQRRKHVADDWALWIADLRAASAVLKELEANDGK